MKEESMIKGSVDPVNMERTEMILNQMKNCVCKIKIGNIQVYITQHTSQPQVLYLQKTYFRIKHQTLIIRITAHNDPLRIRL